MDLKYLKGYSEEILEKVERAIGEKRLGEVILSRYPSKHSIGSDKALYSYAMDIKNRYLKKSAPLSKSSLRS